MVIFHSYVSLPEGIVYVNLNAAKWSNLQKNLHSIPWCRTSCSSKNHKFLGNPIFDGKIQTFSGKNSQLLDVSIRGDAIFGRELRGCTNVQTSSSATVNVTARASNSSGAMAVWNVVFFLCPEKKVESGHML